VAAPLAGAIAVARLEDAAARRVAAGFAVVTLALSIAAAGTVDELSRALLPFAALIHGVVILVIPRLGAARVARRALLGEAVVLATFASESDVVLAALWVLAMLPLVLEGARARAVTLYLSLSSALFVGGVAARHLVADPAAARAWGTSLLLAAILVRKGIVPLHSWMPVLFERGPLPAATLFCMPQVGTYAAARLVAPDAPAWVLTALGALSLFTGVYGAGLALVQTQGRRAFGFLFMSQSALTVAGLQCASTTALAGGLSIWLSSSLALAGLGMTLGVLEARRGDVSLLRYHGGYESTPWLAASFLLLGLASVGFPGTFGFVGAELLVAGSVGVSPWVGAAVVLSSVLNGITVLKMYLRLFCGARRPYHPTLRLRAREHLAFAALVAVLVVTGVAPQRLVRSRALAAERLMAERAAP
jgi:NADH-quinone oxidoreductase subunit M